MVEWARDGVHAEAEQLVLRILRDDARVANPVELDPPASRLRAAQRLDRPVDAADVGLVAVLQEGRNGVGFAGQAVIRESPIASWITATAAYSSADMGLSEIDGASKSLAGQ